MWDRLIKNAVVVDPANKMNCVADVAIKDGRIAAAGPCLDGPALQTDDCSGLHLMPGLIDPHLHLGSMFGSPYGARMAALAGATTALDMAGPLDDVLKYAKETGSGMNIAVLEGFAPKEAFGTLTPTRSQIEEYVDEVLKRGAIGVKIMGGHWPIPLETSRILVEVCNEKDAYIAWHAGSMTAGSNIEGVREAVECVKGLKLHLAHINAYCRGRIASVSDEAFEAIELLKNNPNIWSESYVSPNNGTLLACDEDGSVIDHVTRTCLESFGFAPDADGMRKAFLSRRLFAVKDDGFTSSLIDGEEALKFWEECGTDCAGSFPVNPALSRLICVQARRSDGSFVVDGISTDGGCIPRNVAISVGLSLVKFGAITLDEFVVKTSLNPARHLRLFDRGHLSVGAAADITIFDFEKQKAVEAIASGRTIMKNGEVFGRCLAFVTTSRGEQALQNAGFKTIRTDFSGPEPARFIP